MRQGETKIERDRERVMILKNTDLQQPLRQFRVFKDFGFLCWLKWNVSVAVAQISEIQGSLYLFLSLKSSSVYLFIYLFYSTMSAKDQPELPPYVIPGKIKQLEN